MLLQSVEAGIPLISVTSNDSLNVTDILTYILSDYDVCFGATVTSFLKSKKFSILIVNNVADQCEGITMIDAYNQCVDNERCIIFLNVKKPLHNLLFDAGELPVPKGMIIDVLMNAGFSERHALNLVGCLGGVSLKQIIELCKFTMVRYGELTITGLREIKQQLMPSVDGLEQVNTDLWFYWKNPLIEDYLKLNTFFYLDSTDSRLVPRGILLTGAPGIGKTQASKYIARYWGVPLYMVSMADTMNKYVGESEKNMLKVLRHADKESPCVLLIDEVEKLFDDDTKGTSSRLLSHLLWWLAEHKTKVFTIMTTNNVKILPPELYRPGRIDKVFPLVGLSYSEALQFSNEFLKNFSDVIDYSELVDNKVILQSLFKPIEKTNNVSHAQVVVSMTNAIKEYILHENNIS